jgi:putative ABC transport system permease protein
MRIYRVVLRLYPKSFRAEYAAEMEKDFAHHWRDAAAGARAWLVLNAVVDTLWNAARVHADITKQDVRYSLRSVRRAAGFSATAVAVAALGIGATTAAFSLADHVLIRPLPFPESERLVRVWEELSLRGYARVEPSPPNFEDWRRQSTMFERLEAFTGFGGAMTGRGEATPVIGATVTPGMLPMLGRQAAIGRILTEADVARDAERPIVISDRLWQSLFAASPDVIGQTLTLDRTTYSIIGVMPADFYFPERRTDFWRMLRFSASNGDDDRGNNYLQVIGRLKPGVSIEDAQAELRVIAANLGRLYPKELEGVSATMRPWRDQVAQQPRLLLLGLVGASLCVLLIACTNLANLLMSRALARRTEFAVRAAVGASVDRLVRQMLTESMMLALIGGVLGVLVALASLPLLVRLVPTALPIAELPPLDLRMLTGTLVLTTVTGLAFGLLPAVRVCRKTDPAALKDGARGGTSRGTERMRSTLVVAEIVASVVLIVCVGLLTQALLAVQRVDPGFKVDNLLTMRTALPSTDYGALDRRLQFYSHVLDRVHALPGVESASYISWLPMGAFRGGIWEVLSSNPDATAPDGFAPLRGGERQSASIRFVTPRFFETVGTPVLRGRDVAASDIVTSPFVAVVSESFANKFFPDQDPIGRSFAIGLAARTIVGVVGDIKVRGLERDSEPQVYMPAAQQRMLFFYAPKDLVVRASVPPATLAPAVRGIIASAAPELPITAVQTMEQLVAGETAPRVVQLRVLGGFAVIALLLAAIGIHGLLAFTVTSRAREIGVRIALGAKARDIMWMIVGRSAALTGTGVIVGAVLAYAAGRSLQAVLFGVEPANPAVFGAAAAIAALMALAGSLMPAWRAVRVDPIEVTRSE